ncbi:pentafunctional AROM polypeptide [Aspergillus ellipticus CBS 707.79]|uniref:Pentafunctional AROM polypeptide n=1 Tax=Aspergillus ellipticus CBS 707.79 TaxID=1448320 RepID=A0A319DI26_9EURO|nr:pentafunctional AROM polypeptide [Aspergillus ellipticus CBS 707.79]
MSAVRPPVPPLALLPQPSPESPHCRRRYSPDATLLLVGFVGAGKKTLGIIASVGLRRRFIDFEAIFCQEAQLSPQDFIAQHGSARYRELELQLTRSLLKRCATGCVIVGLGWMANRQQQMLLGEFARDHPVVYVRRDRSDLQQFIATSPETFSRIFDAGNAFFQLCSSFDFFNRTQESTDYAGRPLPANMKLKETERVFLGFLQRIFGRVNRALYSSDPLSASHTYALQVPLTWLDQPDSELEALEGGADAINLVIDMDTYPLSELSEKAVKHMATIRKYTRVPVFAEVVPSQVDSARYRDMLQMLLRLAPDALVCPLGDTQMIEKLNKLKDTTSIIATYHQRVTSPANASGQKMRYLLETAQNLGCDALRITAEPRSPADNLQCVALQQALSEGSKIPIVVYCTGPLGRASTCLNPTLSPVVLPSMQDAGVSLQSAQQALASCFLLPKTLFTVFGQNVARSMSPALHNAAYAACGLPHIYNALPSDNFSDIHNLLNSADHGGVAVSLPYKTEVLPFLNEISPEAKDIRAVNTVVIERNHPTNGNQSTVLRGYNTDYIGIRDCIDKNLSPANAVRRGTSALIVGAGGMARAAIYACYQLGVQHICIYNRTPENARKLADYYSKWADSKPGTRLHLAVLRSLDDPWPITLRQPSIVVACLPVLQPYCQIPVTLQLSDAWLQSTTGGVFIDVCIPQ